MDVFFLEYIEVYRCPLCGKVSKNIIKNCPFPKFILALGEEGVTEEIRKVAGRKKTAQFIEMAKDSIGVNHVEESARLKLRLMLGTGAFEETDAGTGKGYGKCTEQDRLWEFLLSIKGIGVVKSEYNVVVDSSGKNKSGMKISKRGRKNLRDVLYQIALTMVVTNDELK